MAIEKLTDFVKVANDKWTYGESKFGYESEVNQDHNIIYPFLLIKPPTTNIENVYNGWQDHDFEVQFYNTFEKEARDAVELQTRWDNLEDLGLEWMDMILKNYNNTEVIISHDSVVIEREKEDKNDKLVKINMIFQVRMFRRCFNPQYKYPTDVNGLVSWLKADSDVTFNIHKKTASQWLDQTSNNNDVSQLTELSKPLRYGFDGASDKSKITFNGKSQYFESNNNMPITGNDFSIFHVAKCEQLPTTLSQSIISYKDTDGDEEIRNGDFSEIGAEEITNGDFSRIGPENVVNGDFSEEGAEEVLNGDFNQEGAEEVTNGDFANGETDWTFSSQCEVVNNQVRILSTDGSFQYISQNNVFDTSKNYKLEFDIISSNGATLGFAGGIPDIQTTTLGRKTIYTSSSVSYLQIKRSSGVTDVVIDNISVKEVGQDWTLYTGWSIGEDKAICDGGGKINPTNNSWLSGKTYKFDIEVSDRTTGYFRIQNPSVSIYYVNNINSNGTYTYYINTIDANGFVIEAVGFDGSITNISVKEVGQGWTKGSNWTIQNNLAKSDGSQTGNVSLKQSQSLNNLTQGAFYEVTYTISNYQNGSINPHLRGIATGSVAGNGIKTSFGIAGNAINDGINLYANSTFEGSIDNVSVKEVGQGWTFGTGWSIVNGSASHTGVASYLSQDVLQANTLYKVNISVTAVSGGGFVQIYMGNSPASVLISTIGNYTYYFRSQSVTTLGFALRSLGDITVDNISVKEVGQDWSFGSGWGIIGDSAIHDGNSNSNIAQNIPLILGTAYIVTYTVVDASAGSQVGIAPAGTTIQTIRTTNGTYTEVFTAEAVSLYFRSLWNNGNPVSLQNISIRESKSDKLNIGVEPSGRIQFKVLDDNGNEARIISDSSELATSNHIISSRVHNHKLHLQYNNNTEIEGNFPQYSNADGFNITTFRIGSILDGLAENHFNGDIQEIIIYNKYLDDYERDMVKNYLNNKYNIY
tara:strand:+ start:3809 stop:6745 length:2937 start_codon:yes stop_codon:yes gene_type:complete